MNRLIPLLFCAMLAAATLEAAVVNGHVGFMSRRGQNPVVTETLVWLEPVSGRVRSRAAGKFQLLTRGKTLVPHVLAIPAGSTVEFPNDDPISHNLFSLSSPNNFDLGLYRRGAGKSHTFDSPGLVNVYCNIHPSMSAVIQVMGTPYYTFADGAGNYALSDVAAGKYKLVAWNEQGGRTESLIDVGASGKVEGNVALTIDSRDFRMTSHMNKEGKAYSTVKDY